MAYTPINWQTGDTITAEKLNKCDNGWSVTESRTTLCEESVTTAEEDGMIWGELVYATQITADSITVTFNGTEYIVPKAVSDSDAGYGTFSEQEPVFTIYPFFIFSYDDGYNVIQTESAGTYTLKIETVSETIEVSDDFVKVRGWGMAEVSDGFTSAVSSIVSSVTQTPFKITVGTTTFNEIYSAVCTNGRFGYIESSLIANQPVLIEPVIYVLKSSSIFSVKTIGFDGSALVIKTYTASSANGVIAAS